MYHFTSEAEIKHYMFNKQTLIALIVPKSVVAHLGAPNIYPAGDALFTFESSTP